MWWWLLLACPRRAELDRAEELAKLLKAGDEAWENRGVEGFDRVGLALDAAYAREPHEPEVLWRLSRLRLGQGLAAETQEDRLAAFGDARSLAIDCLSVDAGLLQRDLATFSVAAADLPVAEQPCLSYGAHAWAQWVLAFGSDAGRLDLPRIEAMNDAGGQWKGDDGRADWTRALLASAESPADLESANRYFERAVTENPSELVRRADWVEFAALPGKELEEASQQLLYLHEKRAKTPEDRAAVRRAERLR